MTAGSLERVRMTWVDENRKARPPQPDALCLARQADYNLAQPVEKRPAVSTGQSMPNANQGLQAFFRGQFVPLKDANVNIMTHALHYGTGVFEGIRGNWNEEQGVGEHLPPAGALRKAAARLPPADAGHSLLGGRPVPHHGGAGGVERPPAGYLHPAPGLQERRTGGQPEAAGTGQRTSP